MNAKNEFLLKNELFKDLDVQVINEIFEDIHKRPLQKNEIIYTPSDSSEALYFIQGGKVEIYEISPDGKKFTIDILGSGDMFGEMSLIGQSMYGTFAETREQTELCVIGSEKLRVILETYPALALRVIEYLAKRVFYLEHKLQNVMNLDVKTRLIRILIEMANAEVSGKKAISPALTHQELADLIGTSRETLTRTISELKAQGLIEFQNHEIVLLDFEELERMAGS